MVIRLLVVQRFKRCLFIVLTAILALLCLNAGVKKNQWTSISDEPVSITPNQKYILLFFDPSLFDHKSIVFYAQTLFNQFNEKGLQVIAVGKGTKERLQAFARKNEITFPIIHDKGMSIHELFKVAQCCGATVFIDEKGNEKHRFERILEPDSLRQLVEKEVIGTIRFDFQAVKPNIFQLNRQVEDFSLQDAWTGEYIQLHDMEGQKIIITFMASMCGICKTGQRMETIKKLEESIPEGQGIRVKFPVVFMNPVEPVDILEWEKHISIPAQRYLCRYILSDEERYITDKSVKHDPLTIALDRNKRVLYIEKANTSEEQLFEDIKIILKEPK